MALRLAEVEPREYLYVCTPTGDELPAMWAHWRRLGELLGAPIQPIMVAGGLDGLIKRQRALPSWRMRWCTRMLKIEPWKAFLIKRAAKHSLVVSYVGLRADEPEREGGDFGDVPNTVSRFPLREWSWGLADVIAYNATHGIEVPPRTDCARCFYQTIGEWWALWADHPAAFADAERQEAWVSEERGRLTTFRSDGRDSWPASLSGLRARFEAGERPAHAGQGDLFSANKCRVCRI